MCIDALQNSPTVKECVSRTELPFEAEIRMCIEDIKVSFVVLVLLYTTQKEMQHSVFPVQFSFFGKNTKCHKNLISDQNLTKTPV